MVVMLHTTGEFPLCKYIVSQYNTVVNYVTFPLLYCYIKGVYCYEACNNRLPAKTPVFIGL